MNLQQLEYIIAVDNYRHFVTAAEKCFVTQATLSAMIKKLEDELEVKIFDRSRQPVVPTPAGELILKQAREILREANKMKEVVKALKGDISGELHLGIIPTLAPYIVPLFLGSFVKKFPKVQLHISELTTDQIVAEVEKQQLDAGILAIPVGRPGIKERVLFREEFLVYASDNQKLMKKKYLLADDLKSDNLWLLEEGHCLRTQVMNLCELRPERTMENAVRYEAGSLETLKRLVEVQSGITVLPELATLGFSKSEKSRLRSFKSPKPAREIGLITYRDFVKKNLLDAFAEELMRCVDPYLTSKKEVEILSIHPK